MDTEEEEMMTIFCCLPNPCFFTPKVCQVLPLQLGAVNCLVKVKWSCRHWSRRKLKGSDLKADRRMTVWFTTNPFHAWEAVCKKARRCSFGVVISGHEAVPTAQWELEICYKSVIDGKNRPKGTWKWWILWCSVRGRRKSLSMMTMSLLFYLLVANIWDFMHSC